jgi:hypothetical protein
MLQRLALFILGVSAGCGTTVTTSPDADVGVDATTAADAATSAPYIGDVLECGQAGPAGGIGAGTALQRVDLDTTVFPEALCNDGTAAFFYFRPASVAAMSDRWVIQLQGGGGCNTPDSCAQRWCSVDTNFGAQGMTNTLSPPVGIRGDGILQQGGAAGQPNPVGTWNHVFVRYCSSDSWTGTAGPIDVDGHHPITGEPVRYRIAFSGSLILDAVLATLRRDGAAPPTYTLGGGSEPLADLDDAVGVLLAGGSGGGAGVTENVDRVRELLRAQNPAIETMGVIDSYFSPDLEGLDFSTTTMCAQGVCDYQAWEETAAAFSLQAERHDDSCATWHAAHEPETAWKCNDDGHIQRNHITTPILIRQGLLDDNVAGHTIDAMFTVPGRGLMSQQLFAELVATQLRALPGSTPEEAFEQAPAVFAPPCAAHETMSDNQATYDTTLTSAGTPYTMFDVLMNAAAGTTPTALVWSPGDPIDCGP